MFQDTRDLPASKILRAADQLSEVPRGRACTMTFFVEVMMHQLLFPRFLYSPQWHACVTTEGTLHTSHNTW